MSIVNLLSIARSALAAHQRAIDVSGHNIANAGTPGFSRQRITLGTAIAARDPAGPIGRGVQVIDVERVRAGYLDAALRSESGALALSTTMRDRLGDVEAAFGEPSDFGLAMTLEGFWAAWADLANDPLSSSARAAVRGVGRELAAQFHALSDRIDAIGARGSASLRDDVSLVNEATSRIADLNRQIVAERNAPDLADERDRLLDELATLIGAEGVERDDGSLHVSVEGALLVDGVSVNELSVTVSPHGERSVAVGENTVLLPRAGRIAGQLTLLNGTVSEILQNLDALAAAIVTEINMLHRGGTTLAGDPADDFFDSNGVTAATIALSFAVDLSAEAIVAGTGSGPGDGSVALGISGLRDLAVGSLGSRAMGEFYGDLVASVSQRVREHSGSAMVQELFVANLQEQRASVSSVSIDEEMINIIVSQQAYAAAARLVTVADEMMQDILGMV